MSRFNDNCPNYLHRPDRGRRRSFFRRIADSFTSFVSTTIFDKDLNAAEQSNTASVEAPSFVSVAKRPRQEINPGELSVPVRNSSVEWNDGRPQCSSPQEIGLPNNVLSVVDLDANDNGSEHSVSTSGVSSLLPHHDRTYPKNYNKTAGLTIDYFGVTNVHRPSSCVSSVYGSGRKPLWSDGVITELPAVQSFNKSRSKRSRIACDTTRSSATQDRVSPFYSGRTTYGGASNYERQSKPVHDLFETAMPRRIMLEESTAVNTKISLRSEPLTGQTVSHLSSTAKRILENLEKLASPLSTSDRIPVSVYNDRKNKFCKSTRFPPYISAVNRYCLNRDTSQPPSLHSLNILPQPTETDTIYPALKTVAHITTVSTPSSIHVRKVDPPFSNGQSESQIQNEIVFTFSKPLTCATSLKRLESSKHLDEKFQHNFTFSLPAKSLKGLQQKSPTPHMHLPSQLGHMVCDPLESKSRNQRINIFQNISTVPSPAFAAMLPRVKPWRCETCFIENEDSMSICTACSMPRPDSGQSDPPSTVSENDCRQPAVKYASQRSNKGDIFEPSFDRSANQWECSTCMVFNKADRVQCICCQADRPIVGTKKLTLQQTIPLAITAASPTEPKWECPVCMVSNVSDKSTCVCCQAARPTPTNKQLTDEGSGSWACPTCMVHNSAAKLACPCCQATKPAADTASSVQSTCVWDCPTCLVQNKADQVTCPCCQTAKQTTAGSNTNLVTGIKTDSSSPWECPTCLVQNRLTDAACVCCQTERPNSAQTDRPPRPLQQPLLPAIPLPLSVTFDLLPSTASVPFKFGDNSTSTTSTMLPTPKFTFGQPCLSGTGNISFGTAVTLTSFTSSSAPPASTFSFGQPSLSASGAKPSAVANITTTSTMMSMPNFTFGQPVSATSMSSCRLTSATPLSTTAQVTGSVTAAATPSFSVPKSTSLSSQPTFIFGTTPASSSSMKQQGTAARLPFNFNFAPAQPAMNSSASANPTAAVFAFSTPVIPGGLGSMPTPSTTEPGKPFQFNLPSMGTAAASTLTTPTAGSVPPTFSRASDMFCFGATGATATAPPPFGAQPAHAPEQSPGNNMFAAQSQNRPMRRAVRRLRR